MPALALGFAQQDASRRQQIYGLYAFLGRYGHQDNTSLRNMTVLELSEFAEEVGKLIEGENVPNADG